MAFGPGICTTLNKGILACGDEMPKNFTPFLVPPVKDTESQEANSDLLKLVVQEKYDKQDLMLLTKMEVSIPMTAQDLRHHVKNIAGLAGRCLGQSSAIHIALRLLAEHIEDNENEYNYEFHQESLFGGHLLDKIHWRVHKFFDSCARGDEGKIDLGKLNFTEMQIEQRDWITKIPSWIRKLTKRKESKDKDTYTQTSGEGG